MLDSENFEFRYVCEITVKLKAHTYLSSLSLHVYRYTCGVGKPSKSIRTEDRETVIKSFCLHFVILSVKAELDDILDGMSAFGILTFVREYPALCRELFVKGYSKPPTADYVFDLFKPSLSQQGSNMREVEEKQVVNWFNFLRLVEGM